MTSRSILALVVALLAWPAGAVLADGTLTVVYLSRQDDPAYVEQKAYTGLKLREQVPPIDGARAAVKEAAIPGRAAGLKFELVEQVLPVGADAAEAVRRAVDEDTGHVFILDLEYDDVEQLAAAFADNRHAILFNVRHGDDSLRSTACSPALFHTIASAAMLADATAQYLSTMNWRAVLVLASSSQADRTTAAAFAAAAYKFGLTIVDQREFVNSNDPRERERNNPRLLTADADYDVVFLADAEGEYGRYLAYNTFLARPVVGAEGLIASSWHWTWERHGAPQLNQRIRRLAGRDPSAADWAAWAAVKSVVGAAIASGSTRPADLLDALRSQDLSIDLYKVGPGSFRPWDQQLRQAVLLHTHNAVVAAAPFDGFLHRYNTFDTLGFDEPEQRCRIGK